MRCRNTSACWKRAAWSRGAGKGATTFSPSIPVRWTRPMAGSSGCGVIGRSGWTPWSACCVSSTRTARWDERIASMVRDDTTGPIVQIRRRVKATAEQVFDLWTQPDLMVRWMSPFPGAVDCKASCDLRPGGAFSLAMSSGESSREVSGTYVEVDRPRKLVFTWMGPLTNNVNTLVTLELNRRGDETDLVLTHERLPTQAIHEG